MRIKCPRCNEELQICELETIPNPMAKFQATIEVRVWEKNNKTYYGFIYIDTDGEGLISPRFESMEELAHDLSKILIEGVDSVLESGKDE